MEGIKRVVKKVINRFGYELRSKSASQKKYALEYKIEEEYNFELICSHTMLSYLKLATLYEQVIYCDQQGINGDFVECGVWKGGAVGAMVLANLRYGAQRRRIHLFDAFDDLCEPDPEIDGEQAIEDMNQLMGKPVNNLSGKLSPVKGVYDSRGGHGTIEGCKELLIGKLKYDEGLLIFHKGWFQETLPGAVREIDKIAILRLDADWYTSTKICLDYLYDKVMKGGIIIIDDYGRYDGCKKAVDEFLDQRGIKVYLHYADYKGGECRYFIKT
ncbi:MAG: O-methyltransferase [Ulvibacter sp.]|jgi:O-methyltransferase